MGARVVLAYSGGLDTSVAVRWMGEELGVERCVALLLPAVRSQLLAEVAVLVEQPHADQRQAQAPRRGRTKNAHGEPRCSIDSNAGMISSGKRDSTITKLRRRSTMWSMCSIPTGHSWTQAPQVTQSQTAS